MQRDWHKGWEDDHPSQVHPQQNIYTKFQNYNYSFNINIWATGGCMSKITQQFHGEIPGVPTSGETKDIS